MEHVGRRRRQIEKDEPAIGPDDGWVECGGELILPAGFTAGGFPYGTSLREFREWSALDSPGAAWARAKRALERVCAAAAGRDVDVGFVKFVGSGLSRDAFRAEVGGDSSSDVFALVPNRDAEPDYGRRALMELRLLHALSGRPLPFRVPKALGAVREGGELILVEEQVTGLALELRSGRQGKVQPWKEIGFIAAAIHAVPVHELPSGLFPPADCASHGESFARSVAGDEAELRDACDWMLEHLPPAEPGALLHGDLLGQNVFLGIDEPPGVIDWERSEVGDPAYDLAIVTRGVRQPFQVPNGLELLLEAYVAAGGKALAPSRVRFYELGLLAGQYKAALSQRGDVLGARQRLRAMLARLESAVAG